MEWQAFDEFEPIGTRTLPDLVALLTTITANVNRAPGRAPWLPQDLFPDPLAPARLDDAQQAARVNQIAGDYRRLRQERLAREKGEVIH